MFSRRSRAVRQAQEAIERQKQEEAEAEVLRQQQAKKEEARLLNEEVNRRIKRYNSHDFTAGNITDATPDRRASTTRRFSDKIIDRKGMVNATEAELLNKVIKKREAERRERRISGDLMGAADKILSAEKRGEPIDLAPPAPVGDKTPEKRTSSPASSDHGDTSAIKDAEASSHMNVSTPTGGLSTSSAKLYPARARLAEMQREADERKAAVLGAEQPTNSPRVEASAQRVGAARAAAKIAGGVFYTHAERSDMLAHLKRLDARNKELEERLKTYEKQGQAAACTEGVANDERGVQREGSTPPQRRVSLVMNAAAALGAASAASFKKKANGLSAGSTEKENNSSPSVFRRRRLSEGSMSLGSVISQFNGAFAKMHENTSSMLQGASMGTSPYGKRASPYGKRLGVNGGGMSLSNGDEVAARTTSPVLLVRPPAALGGCAKH